MGGICLTAIDCAAIRAKYTKENGGYTPVEKDIHALLDTIEAVRDNLDTIQSEHGLELQHAEPEA